MTFSQAKIRPFWDPFEVLQRRDRGTFQRLVGPTGSNHNKNGWVEKRTFEHPYLEGVPYVSYALGPIFGRKRSLASEVVKRVKRGSNSLTAQRWAWNNLEATKPTP